MMPLSRQQFVSTLFIVIVIAVLVLSDQNLPVQQDSNQRRRRLSDKPLQFLTNLFHHAPRPEKELEFMDPEHLIAHKPKVTDLPSPKISTEASNPLQFLSLSESSAAQPPSRDNTKPKNDGTIHFLHDGETVISGTGGAKSAAVESQKAANAKPKKKKVPQAKKEDLVNIHNQKIEFVNPHPYVSPRNGTDISTEHQGSLLMCPKQATCIVPELQLAKKLKIYLCKHPTGHGVRFYYIAREGLHMHPNVELLTEDRIAEADFIIYPPASAPWHLTECTDPAYRPKLIVLDEFDGHQLISPTITPEQYVERYGGRNKQWYFMYFKRSFVRRLDGDFKRYPHFVQPDVYPLVYAIAEAYVPVHFNNKRDIEIMCTLRGTKGMTTRLRTQTWVAEYGHHNQIENIVTEQLSSATRKEISLTYFQQMFNARIIVTVNPADWEGDFRLWESLCTGALIFVDPLYVPYSYPLIGGEHIVYFDNNNRTDLFTKLDYYRANPAEARRVAINGYLFAMKYHRTVNMIDYILRSADLKRSAVRREPVPHYVYTAQYLNYEAAAQEKMMVKCKSPGRYYPIPSDSHLANMTQSHVHRLSCGSPAEPTIHSGKLPPPQPKIDGSSAGGNIRFGGP